MNWWQVASVGIGSGLVVLWIVSSFSHWLSHKIEERKR